MSNFGQSSLGDTKVGARREHEDSGRGKCFMPGPIRADRNYKGASPSEERMRKEERRGRREAGEGKKETEQRPKSWLKRVVWF